ncbi:hypothetical protein A244_22191, partial [Pseudomonas syringae pv. actinidiae ICMP 18807]
QVSVGNGAFRLLPAGRGSEPGDASLVRERAGMIANNSSLLHKRTQSVQNGMPTRSVSTRSVAR